jgi:Ca2+-binding EF-hand superfamily protein
MKELFEILDVNKDGYIDLKDWQANFPEDIVCGSL